MKRTPLNKAKWDRKFTTVLMKGAAVGDELKGHSKITPAHQMVAAFKVNYPRLMKQVPVKIVPQQSVQAGKVKMGRGGSTILEGSAASDWWGKKATPRIELAAGSPKTVAFFLGHEMQHAKEFRKMTNRRAIGSIFLQKLFVPYGLRPDEWRADAAGVKRVLKTIKMGADEAKQFKREVYGSRAILGAAGVSARTLPAVAAAVMYKRHLDKKKATA